ncbi:unnamed protein product [Cladocopium goreaui]|uniref:Uncharacterized protein n=1 Tax=Cladocopium goreaui TaxID=2562237 RepID=A0A9P1DAT2_9DINO|nr:unnamed protein product [Cladocopium goreaui]
MHAALFGWHHVNERCKVQGDPGCWKTLEAGGGFHHGERPVIQSDSPCCIAVPTLSHVHLVQCKH